MDGTVIAGNNRRTSALYICMNPQSKFRYILIALLACALGIMTSVAQENSSAYNWLNITSSSRIYGLGGLNISLVDDDVQVIDQNPALLGGEMSGQIALNYMRYIGGSNLAGVRYAHSAGDRGAWAAPVSISATAR